MCLSFTPVMCNDHFPNTWLMSPVPDCGLGCAGGCGGGEGLWGRRVRHLHDGHPDCSMQEGAGHLQMKKEEQCC